MNGLKLQIRFTDCDMLGHVNNAIYLNYFETARVYYFGTLLDDSYNYQEKGFLLRKNTVEYLKPLFLKDKAVLKIFCGKIGNKSFSLHYVIYVNDVAITVGESLMVCFNSVTKQTITIPDDLRSALKKLEKYENDL